MDNLTHLHPIKADAFKPRQFDVVYYMVVFKQGKVLSKPLSMMLATHEQAEEYLAETRKTVPTAEILGCASLFSSENDPGRIELLENIVKPVEIQAIKKPN